MTGPSDLLHIDARIAALPLKPGSEWLEALIATGKRYAVPRLTGGADLWDGVVTIKSLSLAVQRHERLRQIYAEMTPAQRDAVWMTPDMAEMCRAVARG